MRPSLLVLQRVKQKVSLIFLVDSSTSMKISDEANDRSRWEMARLALDRAREGLDKLITKDDDSGLDVKFYRFDRELHPGPPPEDMAEPGLIRAFEIYRDDEALKAHGASEHFKAWREVSGQYPREERRLYDATLRV